MSQATWKNNKAKNPSLIPHLKFLKNIDKLATGTWLDTETINENIEDKAYWVSTNNKKEKDKSMPSQINVFTDGSKTKQGAGSGYIIMEGKNTILQTQSINLTGEASIFQAELIAIQEAARYLRLNEDTQGMYIKFFSGSQAALKSNHSKAQTVKNTQDALNVLAEQAKLVHLTWIKAHIGLNGNELADKYAKLGTVDESTQIETPTTGKEIKAAIRDYTYHKWKEKWKSLKTASSSCKLTNLSRQSR